MTTQPAVTVIVPAHNAAGTIQDCIEALRGQRFDQPYEIIVVDDDSSDATASLAEASGARVISRPRGRPAAARNTGIEAAAGSIVCCTDADCVPAPDWLARITAALTDESIAAAKGSYTTHQREIVARFVQLEYEDKYDYMRAAPLIDFIDTYSAAYRRDVLLESGGFDERFDYLEDQELSFRLAEQGCRMVFRPEAVVAHRHAASLPAYGRKKFTIGYWKAQVVRLHPNRAVRDSHTPQVMKVQMGLSFAILGGLALWLTGWLLRGPAPWLGGLGGWSALLAAAAFILTTLPFVGKAWPKDRAVALASPLLLFVRALALGAGYTCGIVRRPRQLSADPTGRAGR